MGSADEAGMPANSELEHLINLAKGKVGLVVPGFMYSMKSGRVFKGQCGFSTEDHANAWESTVAAIHAQGSKVVFQIADAGAAADPAAIDGTPRGPSAFRPGSRAMTNQEIEELVQSYGTATKRLVKIGADGVMVHCAHGYGLGQFLCPWANQRTDKYGGENRSRIVEEIVAEIKRVAPDGFAIVSKINGNDCVEGGVTPELCGEYVRKLSAVGIQMFEISCGFLNAMTMSRAILQEGRSLKSSNVDHLPYWKMILSRINADFPFTRGYTVRYAEVVRRMNPKVPLAIVGGLRSFRMMEKLVTERKCELVSIARPFVRDPFAVRRFFDGELEEVECKSCNQCFCRPVSCRFPDF
jgi:2,4-dienoyl-CoA reductase-like NADH-dependent reductase (Old Yellow Enzyme family)